MDFESFMADVGSEVARDLVYTRAARAGAETPLRLSVFRPAAALRPAPVLVWLQGDAFGRAAPPP
uniref:hypothetical protein n=1 Tax=Roseovarius salis TaxID=3376063 RepID=UPI0037CB31B5